MKRFECITVIWYVIFAVNRDRRWDRSKTSSWKTSLSWRGLFWCSSSSLCVNMIFIPQWMPLTWPWAFVYTIQTLIPKNSLSSNAFNNFGLTFAHLSMVDDFAWRTLENVLNEMAVCTSAGHTDQPQQLYLIWLSPFQIFLWRILLFLCYRVCEEYHCMSLITEEEFWVSAPHFPCNHLKGFNSCSSLYTLK